MQFEEFRLSLMPDLQAPGHWAVHVIASPTAGLAGPKGPANITVTPTQLQRLRNANGWPDAGELRQIGAEVWKSLLPPQADAALRANLAVIGQNNKAMRLVVSVIGGQADVPQNGAISPDEIPIEALFDQALNFVATDRKLPLSRGVAVAPDRPPAKIAAPLRVLLVAAEPSDQPPVNAAAEKGAIQSALQPLVDSGAVHLELCEPATKDEFRTRVQKGVHVVHFVGHGAYRTVATDPTPRPHLCFEDGTALRETDPVDAEQMLVMLRASSVHLVVLTSCQSAAAAPMTAGRYAASSLGSMAQVLLSSPNGPSAAVAMQFDLETSAAQVFSGALYQGLLRNDWTLDEAVAEARASLSLKFGVGHRCCVNPVLYWRSIGGKLFEWEAFSGGSLTDEQVAQLAQIDVEERVRLNLLAEVDALPPDKRIAVAPMRQGWQNRIAELAQDRGNILGDTLRLHGGRVGADGKVQCRLTLKLRRPGLIGDVKVQLAHDAAVFDAAGEVAGANVAAGSLFVQAGNADGRVLLLQNVSSGQTLPPGEYELALITFHRQQANQESMHRLRLVNAEIVFDGVKRPFRALDAIVFSE